MPAPNLSAHFESEHILVRPTYSSKYPPGQSLFLAAGQIIFGAPIVGVWISTALMCAAVCWMLQAWTSPRYALLGGLLCATHIGVIGWWGNTYWGGSAAGLGGALLFGALRRLWDEQPEGASRVRDSLLLGVGVSLLAITRPYEGLLACLPAAAAMVWLTLHRLDRPAALLQTAAPAAAVLLLAGLGIAAHNKAVTGSAATLPYVEHARQYSATPMFIWQQPPEPPPYPHRHLEDFHAGWELKRFQRQDSLAEFPFIALEKSIALWLFYVGSAFTILLAVGVANAWRNRRWRAVLERKGWDGWTLFAVVTCALVFLGILAVPWMNPHYLAPILPLVLFLLVHWLAKLEERRAGAPGLPTALGVLLPARAAAFVWLLPGLVLSYPESSSAWHIQRARLERELAAANGPDLVIVRHGREYRPHEEWVYNGADLESQPVVWAWELNSHSNAALIDHFASRRIWLLDAYRAEPPALVDYPHPPAWLLQEPMPLPIAPADLAATSRLVAADIDGDGRAEALALVAGEGEADHISGVFAWRDGAFEALPVERAAAATERGAVPPRTDPLRTGVDLDGDGSDEIVIANPSEDTISIFSSTTLPLAGVTVRTGINAQAVVAMDADFDGDQDLVVAALHGHGLAVTLNENGNLRPSPAMITVGQRTWFEDKLRFLAAADLDGDGREDLIVAGPAGAFAYLTSAAPQ